MTRFSSSITAKGRARRSSCRRRMACREKLGMRTAAYIRGGVRDGSIGRLIQSGGKPRALPGRFASYGRGVGSCAAGLGFAGFALGFRWLDGEALQQLRFG